jgi:O-succinylbenzoic acid--CoA ligase
MSEPWLATQARQRPDVRALGDLTYAELHARAGAAPAERFIEGGDVAVAVHSCWLRGEAAVPLDPRLTGEERATRRRLAADPPAGTALTVFTSGTTADPKPVHLSFENLRANAVGSALALGLRRDERWLCPLPLSHVGGLMVLARSVIYGTTAIPCAPDTESILDAIAEATLVSLVPTQLGRLLDAGLTGPPDLRAVLLGGGPIAPALAARAAAAAIPVCQTYGLTEATSQVTVSEPGDTSTAGWPLPGTTVTIEDDGEIVVEGPTVAGGGSLRTGDLGRLDERGRLTVVGRKSDTIVSGGENVAPAEVEAVLLEHPAVAEAAVFGRADPEWGERIVAHVVLRAPAEPGDLRDHVAGRLARFKVPKEIEAVQAIPRTASGKVLRRLLS